MKPLDILSALPEWANASHDDILSSPAWAMPCRLGPRQCTMRLDAVRPAETLDIAVQFENEDHILGIAPSPLFQELGAIWPSRAEVPEPILLALVEKDCGELLQLLENAVRRQLKIVGLATAPAAEDARKISATISLPDDEPPLTFSLDLSPALSAALGQLRYIDADHPSIRSARVDAEIEYAAFTLPAADLASLASGDALLLPETETASPRVVAAGKFAVSEAGVAVWKDDGLMRVCAAEGSTMELGVLFDADQGGKSALPPAPAENAPLKLVRLGKTLATGRFGAVAGRHAFLVD